MDRLTMIIAAGREWRACGLQATGMTGMTEKRLAGKTALITGSTRGIGRDIATRLASEGCNLIVHGRDLKDSRCAAEELRASGVETIALAADLSRIEDAHRLADETLAATPHLDILVNNAGMSIRENFWDVSDANFDYQLNVNFRSPYILAQHAARHMIAKGIPGRIVNTSTIGAHLAHKNAAVYDSAKAAVEAMTRNMGWELGPHGITVNCVVPGPIGDRPQASEPEGMWDKISPYVTVGRIGSGMDIAAAVAFFCLPETEFITGQRLIIDGGYGSPLQENYAGI
jgi:NAD(P)-dependent dehydrogenase (short-subunit alcohol dehydrogenase family)